MAHAWRHARRRRLYTLAALITLALTATLVARLALDVTSHRTRPSRSTSAVPPGQQTIAPQPPAGVAVLRQILGH
jgi:hypothetical protein